MAHRPLGKHYIRQWREFRGYSLRKLANLMEAEPGVPLTSHANIGRIETFEQSYTQEILEALADALQVEVTDLLTVDPSKEGEVVDLTALMKGAPDLVKQQALAAARAVLETGTGGIANFFGGVDAGNDASPPVVGRTNEGRGAYKR